MLVVHGIGEQRQGVTLTQWSDALVAWLRRWSSDDPDSALHLSEGTERPVTVTDAQLAPSDGPANLRIELDVEGPRTWLVAEGWWAGAFVPPSFGELWSWSFTSVPATSAMHANAVVGRAIRRYRHAPNLQARIIAGLRIALLMAFVLALVLVSPLVLAFFTALLILGLIAQALPFPAISTIVAKAQLIAVGTIGDSQRLVQSPTQAGAIKAPILEGIRWLRAQGCDEVVVLAHSQGAAVTYKALRDVDAGHHGDDVRISSFISVGSGLPKVHALEHISSSSGPRSLRAASLMVPFAAVVIAGVAWFLRTLTNCDEARFGGVEGCIVERSGLQVTGFAGPIGMTLIGLATATLVALTVRRRHRRERLADAAAVEDRGPVGWLADDVLIGRLRVPRWPLLLGATVGLVWGVISYYGMAFYVIALAIALGVYAVTLIAVDEIPTLENDLGRVADRWIDLYASKDPVPAGPTRTATVGRPESWALSNLGSSTRDHTTYTANTDECLTYVGVELLEVAGAPVHGDAIRARNATYGIERKWRVGWRSFSTAALGVAAVVFAWNTRGQGDDEAQQFYANQLVGDRGLFSWLLPGDLPGFVPTEVGARAGSAMMAVVYLALAVLAVRVGQQLWASWDRYEAGREVGSLRYDEYDIPVPFRVLIAFVVAVVFVALAPFWVLDTWRDVDPTTWTGAGFLSLMAAVPLAVGTYLPRVLVTSGVKERVLARDATRTETLLAFGDYQLERDDVEGALDAYRRALDSARRSNGPTAEAAGGVARALDRSAHLAVERGLPAEATRLQAEAVEHYEEAVAGAAAPSTLIAYANHLASVGHPDTRAARERRARGLVATAGARARELHLPKADIVTLAARLAHFYDGDDERFRTGRRQKAARLVGQHWPELLPGDKLVIGFAFAVAAGPRVGGHIRADLEALLAEGFRATGADLRVSLRKVERDWPAGEQHIMVQLAQAILTPVSSDIDTDGDT